jgi:hypothetical protein
MSKLALVVLVDSDVFPLDGAQDPATHMAIWQAAVDLLPDTLGTRVLAVMTEAEAAVMLFAHATAVRQMGTPTSPRTSRKAH